MKKLLVIIAALFLVATFAMTAAAAEWAFYGSARLDTFGEKLDFNDDFNDFGIVEDTTGYAQTLQDESRIGARVNVSDTLYGRFEYGTENGVANVRKLYGRWDFGAGKLYVGRYYTPLVMSQSNQAWGRVPPWMVSVLFLFLPMSGQGRM